MPLPELHPAACNLPRLLRLLSVVARGIRSRRLMADIARMEPPAVDSALALLSSLDLVERRRAKKPFFALTYRGMELAFARRRRKRLFVLALRRHPVLAQALQTTEGGASEQDVAALLVHHGHGPEEALQQARCLLALFQPLRRIRTHRLKEAHPHQLRLALPRPRPPLGEQRAPSAGPQRGADPTLYWHLLQALLDEGELTLPHVRGILDQHGAQDVDVGPYLEMALYRGDGWRWNDGRHDRLVVSSGAASRRHVADSWLSVALSDPRYREYLDLVAQVGRGSPAAAAVYGRASEPFREWDRRIFGASPRPPAEVVLSIQESGFLGSCTVARPDAGPQPLPVRAPFVSILGHSNLVVTLPPSLDLLLGGPGEVNRALADMRTASQGAGLPSPLHPRAVAHGGLLHPGEEPPRVVPDRVSLRLRLIERVPHFTFLVATLLLHRRTRRRIGVTLRGDRMGLRLGSKDLGPFLDVADALMVHRGWVVSRRNRGGLSPGSFLDLVELTGIGSPVGSDLVLNEDFFWRLHDEPEDSALHDLLLPLQGSLDQDLVELYSKGEL